MKVVSVDDVLKILHKYGKYIFVTDEKRYSSMIDEIANLKALEQEPCEDVISRDCDKCAYYDDGANHEACDECFADEYEHPNFKPKAQHCDDCISRQAVDELSKELVHTTRDKADFLCNFWEGLQKLPSVTPKEKTGHWVKTPKAVMGEGYMWYCDKCEHQVYQDTSRPYPSEKYCPDCGCHMFEPQESEETRNEL